MKESGRWQSGTHDDVYKEEGRKALGVDKDGFVTEIGAGRNRSDGSATPERESLYEAIRPIKTTALCQHCKTGGLVERKPELVEMH